MTSSIINLDGKHINLIDIPSDSHVKVEIEPPQDNTIEYTYYFATQSDLTSKKPTETATGASVAETTTRSDDENYLVLHSDKQLDNIKIHVKTKPLLHSNDYKLTNETMIKYVLIGLILIIGTIMLLRFRKN